MVSTFQPGRSLAIVSLRGAYCSSLPRLFWPASYQPSRSGGRVNSRNMMQSIRRPKCTAKASGFFRRMLDERAASSPTRTRSSSASSSHIRCQSSTASMGTEMPLSPTTAASLKKDHPWDSL